MRKYRWLSVMISLVLVISACSEAGTDKLSDVEMSATVIIMQQTIDFTLVQADHTAQAWMAEQSSEQESFEGGAGTAIPYGAISGTLSYPSESIPALRLVAFNTVSSAFVALELEAGSGDYRMDFVPPGSYQLAAYPIDWEGDTPFAGGYTQAVPCGLQVSCSDHTLITFTVRAGEETVGIDPGDWYASPGTFPPDPTR